MIQFPETAWTEWTVVADSARVGSDLRKRVILDNEIEKAKDKLRINYEAQLLFQMELDAEDQPALELTTLAEYVANPTLAPLDMIDGVLKKDGLCVVLGPSGSGKSTIALQMLNSLMTGDPWLGQATVKQDAAVGLLSFDMDAGMLLDWMAGFPNIDPTKVHALNAYKHGNPLAIPHMRQATVNAWKDAGVKTILLDSFGASFFGQDQNDAAATMAHYRDMKKFALTEVGAEVLIVIVHSTDSSPLKARGSTVHKDTADTTVVVTVDPNTQQRTVQMAKYRAARGKAEMSPVIVTAPDSVTHLVSLDTGAMVLGGLPLPAGSAEMFTEMPEGYEEPDVTDSNEDWEEDDL